VLQKFILSLLVEASKNEDIRAFVSDLIDQLGDKVKDDLLPELLPKLVALLPVFGDALIRQAFELMPGVENIGSGVDVVKGVAEKILESDPDLGPLSDIFDVSEFIRNTFLR